MFRQNWPVWQNVQPVVGALGVHATWPPPKPRERHRLPAAQAFPHVPQLSPSWVVSVHLPLQQDPVDEEPCPMPTPNAHWPPVAFGAQVGGRQRAFWHTRPTGHVP